VKIVLLTCRFCDKAILPLAKTITMRKEDVRIVVHLKCMDDAASKRYATPHRCSVACEFLPCPYQ
jgi:hypothetical protein